MRKILFFFLWITACMHQVYASPVVLNGIVLDENQQPLPNINLLVYPAHQNNLVAFGVSDRQGTFSIGLNAPTDSLRIEATSLHYRTHSKLIDYRSQDIEFHLVPEVKTLEEFTVRARPIVQRGDTISYMVSSFAREQDRTLSDVLNQMPGIEIEPGGRILYQGAPIQHFYVEGLDLMGGRYAMVSKNMPHRSVATVQVLENHQPLEILRDRVPSMRTSINISLKRDITTTGNAWLGSGYEPLLWDANITPMVFTSDFQVAGSLQSNNTGKDVGRQLDALSIEELNEQPHARRQNFSKVGIDEMTPPSINENRYLDNNIHLVNANSLLRLPHELQLRTNVFYIYDFRQQQGSTMRTLYIPGDTLQFEDFVHNEIRKNALHAELTLTRNTKNNYLNNKISLQTHWDKHKGDHQENLSEIHQRLRDPFHSFNNNLRMVKSIGQKLVRFNSHIAYREAPQRLRVERTLSESDPLLQTTQHINARQFTADHSVGLTFDWKGWSISPRMGFMYQQYDLQTRLNGYTDFGEEAPDITLQNALEGMYSRAYLQTEWTYRRGSRFMLTLNLPLQYVYIDARDKNIQEDQQISRVVSDPGIRTEFRLTSNWRARGSYSFNHNFGQIDELHYGYIMKTHRSIHLNDAPLQQGQNHRFTVNVQYRNPLNALFGSMAYFYTIHQNSLLYSHKVDPNGHSVLQAMPLHHTSYMHMANARVGRYFHALKSTLSLQGSYSRNERPLWINQKMIEGVNHLYTVTPRASVRINRWINSDYRVVYLRNQTHRNQQKFNQVTQWKHFAGLLIIPVSGHEVSVSGEYYRHQNQSNYFVDIKYRFRISSRGLEMDVRWLNILNNKTYHDYQLSAWSFQVNQYQLRPSQLMASLRFSF